MKVDEKKEGTSSCTSISLWLYSLWTDFTNILKLNFNNDGSYKLFSILVILESEGVSKSYKRMGLNGLLQR
jgi:hypothetical protein